MKDTINTNFIKYYWLISLILGVLGTCTLFFATTKNGIGVSPDTTLYFSVANDMANLVRYGGDAGTLIIAEPPLFPAVLALFKLVTGAEPFMIARYLNAITFGFVIFLSGLMFNRFFGSTPLFFIVGTISVLISYSLVSVYLMALTEPQFILFVLMFMFFLNSHLTKPKKMSLLLLSLSAMLAFLTRYIGAVLIFVGVICMLLFLTVNWKERIRQSVIFSLMAGLPTSLWVVRDINSFTKNVSSTIPPKYSLLQNIGNALDNILSWFVPYRVIHNRIFLIVLCFLVGLFASFLIWDLLKKDRKVNQKVLLFYGPLVVLIVSYFAFLLLLIRFVVDVEDRYLAPIFIPIAILILGTVRGGISLVRNHVNSKLVALFTVVIIIAWLVIPINKSVHVIDKHYWEGNGYSSRTWQESGIVQYIVENFQECTYYSNRNDAIKYLTGLDTKLIPVKFSSEGEPIPVEEIWPPRGKTCLVFFDNINRYYMYTKEELLAVTDVKDTIQFDDGIIYIITGR